MESFFTIQGEGYNVGCPAYFIRIGGCDIGCHWCDVKESWNAAQHPQRALDKLVEEVLDYAAKNCVITGGEPLIYDLNPLTHELKRHKIKCWLETSGAYPLTGTWDWVCLSPKKTKLPLHDVCIQADELKIVIYNDNDFQWAEKQALKVKQDCKLYLQPEWSVMQKMMPKIVDYVKKHSKWKISLQTHKFMNIP